MWYVFAKSGHAGNRGCIDGSVSLSSSFLEERNARLEKCRYSEIRYEVRQALVKWWKGGGREAVSERERGWGGRDGGREGSAISWVMTLCCSVYRDTLRYLYLQRQCPVE